jgi:hypothetical protein
VKIGQLMNVSLARPRVADLVFRLYGKPIHPELFEIHAGAKISREDYELTVWITRTGHVFSWHNADIFITEVTASIDQILPQRRRLIHHRLRGEQSDRVDYLRGINYQTTFQVETLPKEIFGHVHEEIEKDASKRGLLYHFPTSSDLLPAPLGYVSVETKNGCMFLSSFHTFPDELTVVKTQSLLEKAP